MSLETLDRAIGKTVDMSVGDIVAKYPSKQAIVQAFQRGEILDEAKAVMAGMMIDRIAASAIQPPTGTVKDEVFAAQESPAGLAAAQQMQGQPQPQAPGQGIDQIPVPDQMFAPQGMAGGGIVAFQAGGTSAANLPMSTRLQLREQMTEEEKMMFDRTGQIPKRIQMPDLRAPVRMEGGRPVPVDVSSGMELKPQITPSTAEIAQESVPAATPSAGIGSIPIQPLVTRATQLADAIRPQTETSVPTVQEASKQTADLLKESGYDESVLGRIRQDIEEQRKSMAGDKKEAMNLRLIEAGLGIMGGESPYAFTNIGKGATAALKGLSEDIKELKKTERDLRSAEQNLLLKQNEAAMGKARVTQSTIDKAQERVDREKESRDRLVGDLTKTMLSGEVQERLARATYGKMTDFDKKWKIYTEQAKARGETPSTEGFGRAFGVDRETLSFKDAMALAQKDTSLSLADAEEAALKLMQRNQELRGSTQGARSPEDQQALAWANANPNDPRAKQIKEYLGVK